MISVAATSGLVEAIRAAGANPDQVLRMFQLDPSVLSNTEKFIPCPVFARILEEAAGVTGDDCFGLHLGERFNPKNIGPLTYVVLNSPTVAVAGDQVARYLKLYNQAATVRAGSKESARIFDMSCAIWESSHHANKTSTAWQ
jgi:hypothetical protein